MTTYTHKMIDPVKVAKLDGPEYDRLYQAVDLIQSGTYIESFPAEFKASVFWTMKKLGSTVKSTRDMLIIAQMLRSSRPLIESLRAYPV